MRIIAAVFILISLNASCGSGISDRYPEGKEAWVYVGGDFSVTSGSKTWNDLARFYLDGSLDTSFPPVTLGGNAEIKALAAAPDGSGVFVGGDFATVTVGGEVSGANNLFKMNHDGTVAGLWTDALEGADNLVETLLVSGDSLYVGGAFTTFRDNASVDNAHARLTKLDASTGNFVSAFMSGGLGITAGVVNAFVETAGLLYVGGNFTAASYSHDGGPASGPARVIRVDTTTGAPNVNGDYASGVADGSVTTLETDGTYLYVGGTFSGAGTCFGQSFAYLCRIETDSVTPTIDGAYDPSPDGNIWSLLQAPAGLYVGGQFTQLGFDSQNLAGIGLMNNEFANDAFLGNSGNGVDTQPFALTFHAGRLYAGGGWTGYNDGTTVSSSRFVVLDPDTGRVLVDTGIVGGAIFAIEVVDR